MGSTQLSGIPLTKCTSFLDCRMKIAMLLTCKIEGIVIENLEAKFLSFNSYCHFEQDNSLSWGCPLHCNMFRDSSSF